MTFTEAMYLLGGAGFLAALCIGSWVLDRMEIDDEDWWLP